MKSYIVRQGDYLTKLAHLMGFDADEVWNDAQNADLKQKREDMNMLCPGDVLYLPDSAPEPLPLAKGATNHYVGEVPKVSVVLMLHDGDEPVANEPYTVLGLGPPIDGTSGPDGKVTIEAPVHVREVMVKLSSRHIPLHVRIGDLDPIDEPSGLHQRLGHLRHTDEAAQRALAEFTGAEVTHPLQRLLSAVSAFQQSAGLEVTGLAGSDLYDALKNKHGI